MKRLDQLTFIRFGMVILIVFFHGYGGIYTGWMLKIPFFDSLLGTATTAVGFMYVLSGFVMSLVYHKSEEKFEIANYWKARFVRIYPLYIFAFLLTCLYYFDAFISVKPQKILANIFAVQAWIPAYAQSFNYPAWSITVEIFFYLIFPFLTIWSYRISTKKLISGSMIFWAISQLIYHIVWIGWFDTQRQFVLYFPLIHLNSFVVGVVGGIWYVREGRLVAHNPVHNRFLFGLSIIFSLGYLILGMRYVPSLPHGLQPMAGILAPIMLLFIMTLSLDNTRLSKYLQLPWLVTLGESSYAIYILHVPISWLFEKYLAEFNIPNAIWVFSVFNVPLIVLFSVGLYMFFDTPLRNWMREYFKTIDIRLLLLDFAIFIPVTFFIFQIRFDEREYRLLYREMERVVFWVGFFSRPLLLTIFGSYRLSNLFSEHYKWQMPVVASFSISTLLMMAVAYWGYVTGWFENFPRSVFVLDWVIITAFSLIIRFALRKLGIYKQEAVPA